MTISVIVPTFRRVPELGRCLAALEKQQRVPDEVILTVRDTDSETRGYLATRASAVFPLRVIEVAVPGVIAAMNAALAVATGQIIALTDDDGAPWPDWLERINASFEAAPKLGGLGGRDWQYYNGKLHIDGVAPKRCGQLQWFGRVSAGHHLAPPGPAYEAVSVKGVNCAYRAEALKPIGFDTRLAGTGAQVHWELSLGLALRRGGWKIVFDPNLGVDHFPAARFDEDQRSKFNSLALQNAVSNETLSLLEHLGAVRRWAFIFWSMLLGTNSYPGAIQVGRLLLTNRRPVWGRWWATMRGRWMGWRIYRTGAVLRVGAGRDAPLVPGAIHDSPPSLTTSAIQPRADVKIRILLVSPIGEIGGGEQVLLRVAEGLRQRGHEAALACMRPGPLLEAARRLDIAAHAFEPHRYRQLLQVRRGRAWLTRLAREEGADLLHANHTAQIYASSAGRGAGIGVVWHLHDFAYKFDWVERWCQLLPFDHVIFTTEKVRSGYPRFARRPQSVIAPVTVDPQRLLGVRPDSSVRDRLGLESGPILLTVARLQEHKGHADLLNAVPMVLKQFPDAQFLIVGKASGSQQEQYLQGLRGQAENLGISRSVKFTGFVEETELVWLYREATALVHPARSEGFGLTLLEAMAFGLPVIAADADGPRGIIGDGPAGRLVRRGDCGALAGAIVELLADPAEARRRAAGGLDPRYQLSTMVDQTLCVYQSVLGRRTRSESP